MIERDLIKLDKALKELKSLTVTENWHEWATAGQTE